MRYLLLLFFMSTSLALAGPIPENCEQMVLVVTADWNEPGGRLVCYRRQEGRWKPADLAFPIIVGRSGLGWGLGLHSKQKGGPVKKEGDGRGPAGVFRLTRLFGIGQRDFPKGLPYLPLDRQECVDDGKSKHYNEIVDPAEVEKDWNSSEKMKIPAYNLGVQVEHNPDNIAGCGSCIFIHRWRNSTSPTAGCTAMEADQLEKLAAWLQRDAQPVLVQLPRAQYEKLKTAWNLP